MRPALLAEVLELAPYRKFLYSPDAFGLPELYYQGAALFHRALSGFLAAGLPEDLYSERAVARLTGMLCAKTPDVPVGSVTRGDSGQRGCSGRDVGTPEVRLRQ
jgi:hypothetical protein